jgi:hypothetical protein
LSTSQEVFFGFKPVLEKSDYQSSCGGNTRDPKRRLEIYYFWDDDPQQVMVGWLPGHLVNRLT